VAWTGGVGLRWPQIETARPAMLLSHRRNSRRSRNHWSQGGFGKVIADLVESYVDPAASKPVSEAAKAAMATLIEDRSPDVRVLGG